MTDIIKEFNMIDVLGILLPGALLTALFGTEFGLWARISLYFGVTLTTGMVSAILIIAGFAFGCLLHELGDLVEKFLWSSKLLSPKTYAAIRSGYAAHFIDRNQALLEELEKKESENEPFTLRTVPALALLIGGGLAALLGAGGSWADWRRGWCCWTGRAGSTGSGSAPWWPEAWTGRCWPCGPSVGTTWSCPSTWRRRTRRTNSTWRRSCASGTCSRASRPWPGT